MGKIQLYVIFLILSGVFIYGETCQNICLGHDYHECSALTTTGYGCSGNRCYYNIIVGTSDDCSGETPYCRCWDRYDDCGSDYTECTYKCDASGCGCPDECTSSEYRQDSIDTYCGSILSCTNGYQNPMTCHGGYLGSCQWVAFGSYCTPPYCECVCNLPSEKSNIPCTDSCPDPACGEPTGSSASEIFSNMNKYYWGSGTCSDGYCYYDFVQQCEGLRIYADSGSAIPIGNSGVNTYQQSVAFDQSCDASAGGCRFYCPDDSSLSDQCVYDWTVLREIGMYSSAYSEPVEEGVGSGGGLYYVDYDCDDDGTGLRDNTVGHDPPSYVVEEAGDHYCDGILIKRIHGSCGSYTLPISESYPDIGRQQAYCYHDDANDETLGTGCFSTTEPGTEYCDGSTGVVQNCGADEYCHYDGTDVWCGPLCSDDGESCSTDEECCSNHCIGGICCDTLCNGVCDSCNPSGECISDYYITVGIGSGGCCSSGSSNICVDSINSCQDEYSDETTCDDGKDNDCDGESDYDSQDLLHGDDDCPVGIDDIAISDDMPCENSILYVNCTSTQRSINSVNAYVDLDSDDLYEVDEMCTFIGWDASNPIAKFSCSMGGSGYMRAKCSIDTSRSYAISGKEEKISDMMDVGGNKPKIIAMTPSNGSVITDIWVGFPVVFNYTVIDEDDLSFDCRLLVDGSEEESELGVEKDVMHRFSKYVNNGVHEWSIECSDSGSCDSVNTTGNFSFELDVEENVTVKSLGAVGFEESNDECTNQKTVLLYSVFDPSSFGCRYRNGNSEWSEWISCVTPRYWYLDPDAGIQTVHYEVMHSDSSISSGYDTIEYDPTGKCFLANEPNLPLVEDMGDFSNDPDTISAAWYGANDPDANKLGISLIYEYLIYDSTDETIILDWTDSGENTGFVEDDLELEQYHNYTIFVRVNNSEILSGNNASSDGVFIDWTDPVMQSISVSDETCLNDEYWSNMSDVSFEWVTSDDESGIFGYSMVLDQLPDTFPDSVFEMSGAFSMKLFEGIVDGEDYYFHIIAGDNAGNMMDVPVTFGPFGVDTVKPTIPFVDESEVYAESNEITIFWEASYDSGSGVRGYWLNLTDLDRNISNYLWVGNVRSKVMSVIQGHNYHAEVIAEDHAGWKSNMPDVVDIEPPVITFKKPDGLVANYPKFVLATNEQCVCQYNLDGEWVDFIYTNSTYHETQYGSYEGQVDVICRDMAGLSVTDTITFSDGRTSDLSGLMITQMNDLIYAGTKCTFKIELSPQVGDILPDDFRLYLDGEMFNDSNIVDLGRGVYSISISIEDSGNAVFGVFVGHIDGVYSDISFDVIDAYQVFSYTKDEGDVGSLSNLVYSGSDGQIYGIGSDSGDADIFFDSENLGMNSNLDGTNYFFYMGDNSFLDEKNRLLDKDDLEDPIISFGNPNRIEYHIKDLLVYQDLIFDELELSKGSYSLSVKNLGIDEDDRILLGISVVDK